MLEREAGFEQLEKEKGITEFTWQQKMMQVNLLIHHNYVYIFFCFFLILLVFGVFLSLIDTLILCGTNSHCSTGTSSGCCQVCLCFRHSFLIILI